MNDILVGRLFNDFVDLFQIITRTNNRMKAICRINNGLCGIAAMAVGNVLIHGYGYDPKRVEWRSHCLHMWLRVDGVDYDSMYPQGYDKPVVEEWLLSEAHYNTHEMGEAITSKEDNSGYQQRHLWYCLLVNECFYARFNVDPPKYVAEQRHYLVSNGDTEDFRLANRYIRRAKRALLHPLRALVSPVEPTGVYPQLHYHYGEFEETTDRVLRYPPFDVRGVSKARAVALHKKLHKASVKEGIHVRRL